MEGFTGFYTTSGLPIYSNSCVEERRRLFKEKKIKDFIAQPGGQEDSLMVDADIVITGGNRGGGKANTYNTDVITPTGTVKMGDLKVGDPICTPYEGTQEVEAIFEQGEQKVFKFFFDDGTECTVMDNHRFMARNSKDAPWEVMDARTIMNRYRIDHEYPNSRRQGIETYTEIPVCGEIGLREGMDEFNLPLHPYVLGCICARGRLDMAKHRAAIEGYTPEAQQRVRNLGFKWHFNEITGQNELFGYTVEQRRFFCGDSKFVSTRFRIPEVYMTASKSARWELLHGIMDVAGTTWCGKNCLPADNRKFLEDVAWIARSLGIWCRIERAKTQDGFALFFKAWDNVVLFYSKERHAWCKMYGEYANGLSQNILTKRILHVKRCREKQKCRCIQVSGKDHLYLTDAFTVNHNTVMLLMNPMYNVNNAAFNGIILRKEKGDLDNIIRESNNLYGMKGEYKSSYMRWDFASNAQLLFSYFTGTYEDFKDRMQGRQYAYVGVDEITQLGYDKFKYLITSNRNGAHIRNRFLGTCNPDPTSWVRKFIDWWIGEDGYPIPERNGVVRYCFMGGDTPEDITWGSTRLEVYEKVRSKIDPLVSEADALPPEYMYVKSVVFVRAELDDNRALLESSPEYKANLAQQSDEQRERDFKGNWNYMSAGDDLIKMYHLQRCFDNPQMLGDGVRRMSVDVALEGGDSCVMWLWIGNHIQDVFVCHLDAETTVTAIRTKMEEWKVLEENMVYDLQGVGQFVRGFFKRAKPFNNQEAVDERYKGMYDTKKSQCMKNFADAIIRGEISFEPSILDRHFSGRNYKNKELRDILQEERKVFCQDLRKQDRGWCNIDKESMKRIIGRSPDFAESLMMQRIFYIVRQNNVSVNSHSWLKQMAGRNGFHVRKLA